VQACPAHGLVAGESGIEIDREKCEACGTCVEVCPTGAMEIKGEVWTIDGLMEEILKDRSYFGEDGGVTFSGGESLMQPDFVIEALKRLRAEGVHTAVDTAGLVSEAAMVGALENADLILYDLKVFERDEHEQHTGAPNDVILKNARLAAEYHAKHGKPAIWIRTPVIPGATDGEENIIAIGKFIAEYMNEDIDRWELCAYNNLCQSKYNRLGAKWQFEDAEKIEEKTMAHLTDVAKSSGADPAKILWTGSTRMEKQEDENA